MQELVPLVSIRVMVVAIVMAMVVTIVMVMVFIIIKKIGLRLKCLYYDLCLPTKNFISKVFIYIFYYHGTHLNYNYVHERLLLFFLLFLVYLPIFL